VIIYKSHKKYHTIHSLPQIGSWIRVRSCWKAWVSSASNQGRKPGWRTTGLKLPCHTRMRILFSAGLI
jgi:hypothetical protein